MAEPQTVETTEPINPSLDDRLNKLFGEKEAQPEAELEATETQDETPETPSVEAKPEETPAEEVIEVEFNGVKYQVPPELKDVLMKSADYTQKTQTLAQQRRDLELQNKEILLHRENQAFEQSIAQEAEQLKLIEQYIPYMKQNTDWNKLTTDQFVRRQKEISDLEDQRRDLSAAIHGKRQEFAGKIEAARAKLKTEMSESLSKSIPGWNDTVKGEVEAFVKAIGYPEAAIPHMTSIDYQVAWKASQYDRLKTQTASAVKKAGEAPVIKATSRKEMPTQVKEMLNTRKAIQRSQPGSSERKAAVDKRLGQIFGG
jgi:hypothetical protein